MAVTNGISTRYAYDANGNTLSGNGKTYAWTAFNKPWKIDANGAESQFWYAPIEVATSKSPATTTASPPPPRSTSADCFRSKFMANILDALFTAGDVPGGVFAYKAIPLEVNVPLKAAFKDTYVDYYKANKFWGKVLDHTVPLHQYREVIPTGQVFEGESRWFLQGTPFPIHPLWRAMLGIPSEDQVYLANPFH